MWSSPRPIRCNISSAGGINPLYLQEATPDRVTDPQSWGHYYEHAPKVLAGEIRSGWAKLQAMPAMQPLLKSAACR